MKKTEKFIRIANIIEEGRLGGPQTRMTLVASALSENIKTTFIFPKKDSKEFQERCDNIGINYYLFSFTRIRPLYMVKNHEIRPMIAKDMIKITTICIN